jgi:hypothetical protein
MTSMVSRPRRRCRSFWTSRAMRSACPPCMSQGCAGRCRPTSSRPGPAGGAWVVAALSRREEGRVDGAPSSIDRQRSAEICQWAREQLDPGGEPLRRPSRPRSSGRDEVAPGVAHVRRQGPGSRDRPVLGIGCATLDRTFATRAILLLLRNRRPVRAVAVELARIATLVLDTSSRRAPGRGDRGGRRCSRNERFRAFSPRLSGTRARGDHAGRAGGACAVLVLGQRVQPRLTLRWLARVWESTAGACLGGRGRRSR